MGRPRKNPQNSNGKGKANGTQVSSRSLSVKSSGNLIPIFEGQSSNTKSHNLSEMQDEIDRLKALLESVNRRAEKERELNKFEVQSDNLENTQKQGTPA